MENIIILKSNYQKKVIILCEILEVILFTFNKFNQLNKNSIFSRNFNYLNHNKYDSVIAAFIHLVPLKTYYLPHK